VRKTEERRDTLWTIDSDLISALFLYVGPEPALVPL
jgi:hypothetical protein